MKLVCLALDVTSDLRQQRLKMCLQTGRSMDPINFDINSYGLYSGSNASIVIVIVWLLNILVIGPLLVLDLSCAGPVTVLKGVDVHSVGVVLWRNLVIFRLLKIFDLNATPLPNKYMLRGTVDERYSVWTGLNCVGGGGGGGGAGGRELQMFGIPAQCKNVNDLRMRMLIVLLGHSSETLPPLSWYDPFFFCPKVGILKHSSYQKCNAPLMSGFPHSLAV